MTQRRLPFTRENMSTGVSKKTIYPEASVVDGSAQFDVTNIGIVIC